MNVVITSLFTRHPDPQSRKHWPADVGKLTVLDSAHRHGWHAVVINDCLDESDTADTTFVRVDNDIPNAYWARWTHIDRYIEEHHDELCWVWCVDAGDVTMLNDPRPQMDGSVLYIGSEPTDGPNTRNVGFWWMRHLHPDHADWIDANATRPLLNCGIVGGRWSVVEAFANMLANGWPSHDVTDMAAANELAYSNYWIGRTITGHPVHTPMWSFTTNDPHCWWAHK